MAAPWRYVSDGGLETDLIFHHGVDLPEFAAYPLLRSADGRALLRWYFEGYAAIAQRAGAGLRLESPTWRANPDWGAVLGHDAAALDAANQEAIAFLRGIQQDWSDRIDDIVVVGMVGPRGDGYAAGSAATADEAAEYHEAQVASFAAAGVDEVEALTMTDAHEAQGVAMAAASFGMPAVLSFTVETDGRLPDGTSLGDAVTAVDDAASPAHFMVNCAHPKHVLKAFADAGPWVERIRGVRSNASRSSHAELDEAETLDEGDVDLLVSSHRTLEEHLPTLEIVGGCCGTDARHVAALWGV
jgi:S-methylmethionine-dependent homocysteine/selenocysteine methylase